MERKIVQSSNLDSVGYDAKEKLLEIKFKWGGTYQYLNVPEEIYQELMSAKSVGKYFNQNIFDKYLYKIV